jgi:hypothetical protein
MNDNYAAQLIQTMQQILQELRNIQAELARIRTAVRAS